MRWSQCSFPGQRSVFRDTATAVVSKRVGPAPRGWADRSSPQTAGGIATAARLECEVTASRPDLTSGRCLQSLAHSCSAKRMEAPSDPFLWLWRAAEPTRTRCRDCPVRCNARRSCCCDLLVDGGWSQQSSPLWSDCRHDWTSDGGKLPRPLLPSVQFLVTCFGSEPRSVAASGSTAA